MDHIGSTQVILLTATVRPKPNTHALKRASETERLQDYVQAFDYYLSVLKRESDVRLCLVENSGHDLVVFDEMVKSSGLEGRVELVGYTANDPQQTNRFFLEAALLRKALEISEFLKEPGIRIWKVTGRYIVLNLLSVIRAAPKDVDIYVNFRNYPQKALDFFLAAFSRKGLEAVVTRHSETYKVTDTGEDIFRRHIEDGVFDDLKLINRHNRVANVRGVRGVDGRNYGGGVQLFKYWTRYTLNQIAPGIWI